MYGSGGKPVGATFSETVRCEDYASVVGLPVRRIKQSCQGQQFTEVLGSITATLQHKKTVIRPYNQYILLSTKPGKHTLCVVQFLVLNQVLRKQG